MDVQNHEVPLIGGGTLTFDLSAGQTVTVVGPNGSGKSALSASLSSALASFQINRVFAHRRLWLTTSEAGMSASERTTYTSSVERMDSQVESRWRDQMDRYRPQAIISDLMALQNGVNATIAAHVRSGDSLQNLSTEGPVQILNSLLKSAVLQIQIIEEYGPELLVKNSDDQSYPAAEMSDGEKAALFLLADVLTSELGSIHLIDEPERHLHRSISGPLITLLTQVRPNDAFVIFTHDIDLAQELGVAGTTYVVAACEWVGKKPQAWALQRLPPSASMPEDLRRALLGGRSRVVFHEGVEGGLDHLLYKSLLVGRHVVPVGSCNEVLRSVAGLRGSESLHWVDAAGIVDKDFRRDTAPRDIYHLKVHEVENVFYLPLVTCFMSRLQAEHTGRDATSLESAAIEAMKAAMLDKGVKGNTLQKMRLQQVRDQLLDQVHSLTELPPAGEVTMSAMPDVRGTELEYDKFLDEGIDSFLKVFPIRESKARAAAAKAMLYPSADLYEQSVTQQLRLNEDFRSDVLAAIGIDYL